MKRLLFVIGSLMGLLVAPPPVYAQKKGKKTLKTVIGGHWEGVVTQDFKDAKTGLTNRIEYTMYLDIRQYGETVSGTATFVYTDEKKAKKYQSTMEVVGTFKSNTLFQYTETQIMKADSVPNSEWCQKKATLIFRMNNNQPTLEGLWEGSTASFGTCAPGRILLRKPPSKV
jgi:hypothetical protein